MKREIIDREFITFEDLTKRCTLTNKHMAQLLTKSGLDVKINGNNYNVRIIGTHEEETFILSLEEYVEEGFSQDNILKEKIIGIMVKSGYSKDDTKTLESLILLYQDDIQFQEAVDSDYYIWDYDNWKDLQRVMGIVLDYQTAMSVLRALDEEDITIGELCDNSKEVTNEMIKGYYFGNN